MGRNNENEIEMEKIQRGLEEFLDRELKDTAADTQEKRNRQTNRGQSVRQGQGAVQVQSIRRGQGVGQEQSIRRGQEVRQRQGARQGQGVVQVQSIRQGQGVSQEQSSRQRQSVRQEQSIMSDNIRSGGSRSGGSRNSKSKGKTNQKSSRARGNNSGAKGNNSAARGDSRGKSNKSSNKKKKSKFKRFITVMLLIVVLLGVGLYSLVGVVYNKLNYKEIASVSGLPMQEDGVVNVILIGNDSRGNGEDGRSDAMILLSISNKTKTIYMTSLLRDMYVEIPGHDSNRLNAAYSFGGAELLMETVEKNFDIPVNRYMQVNFEAFANLVDAVGGVELELSLEEVEYVNGYLVEYNMLLERPQGTDNLDPTVSGLIHLNGPQALAYCRNRYLGTDFGRTERQRKVLNAVIKKLPKTLALNGPELFNGLMPNLTTNLTKNECFRLGLMAGRLLTYDIVSDSIPQPGTYRDITVRKMAVLEVDFETNKAYLKERIYGEK